MKPLNPDGAVMKIVELVLELVKYKKAYRKLEYENKFLRERLQIKPKFEVRI